MTNANGLEVAFENSLLGISETKILKNGANSIPEIVFYGQSSYDLNFKGVGTVSIEFRIGRL